jgi:prevent-host-death family protein
MEVNIHQAKTHLSRLLQRVIEGEEITIARAGVPVAKLIGAGPPGGSRPMGMDQGKIWMAEDFDVSDPKLEALFYEAPVTTGSRGKRPRSRKRKA